MHVLVLWKAAAVERLVVQWLRQGYTSSQSKLYDVETDIVDLDAVLSCSPACMLSPLFVPRVHTLGPGEDQHGITMDSVASPQPVVCFFLPGVKNSAQTESGLDSIILRLKFAQLAQSG